MRTAAWTPAPRAPVFFLVFLGAGCGGTTFLDPVRAGDGRDAGSRLTGIEPGVTLGLPDNVPGDAGILPAEDATALTDGGSGCGYEAGALEEICMWPECGQATR